MKFGIVTVAALAAVAFAAAPALAARTAPKEAFIPVARSVIDAGPVILDDTPEGHAYAEHLYLTAVCPTVLHAQGQYQPDLVAFCKEYRPG